MSASPVPHRVPSPAQIGDEEDKAKRKKMEVEGDELEGAKRSKTGLIQRRFKVSQAMLDDLMAHPLKPFVGVCLDDVPEGEQRDRLAADMEAVRKVHAELMDVVAQYKATGEAYMVVEAPEDDDDLAQVDDVRATLEMADRMMRQLLEQ